MVVLSVPAFEEGKYIIMATKNGQVKKTELTEYSNPRSTGIIALTIAEGDELNILNSMNPLSWVGAVVE